MAVPAFRTLLAGSFAMPDNPGRLLLEAMLVTITGNRGHLVLPGCPERCLIEQAETQLACDGVDIVVLDLDGPVETVLSLVNRLRASAAQGVIFVGVLARHATAAARLYLSAVVDGVVEAPLRAASLHRAIADALREASDFRHGHSGSLAAGVTRH